MDQLCPFYSGQQKIESCCYSKEICLKKVGPICQNSSKKILPYGDKLNKKVKRVYFSNRLDESVFKIFDWKFNSSSQFKKKSV